MDWKSEKVTFTLLTAIYGSVVYQLHLLLNDVQPTPFIDEVFHIPQAQAYCNGNFSHWDSKITTLPGLYLFSVGLNGLQGLFTQDYDYTVSSLRMTNVICGMLTLPTIYLYLKYLHGKQIGPNKLILASVNLSLFPVLHWFNYLYYTDVLSTLLVLVLLLLHEYREFKMASFIGLMAIMTRQTNVLWVCFATALQVADNLNLHNLSLDNKGLQFILKTIRDYRKIIQSLRKCLHYIFLICLFIIFVFVNGSIVVGDKAVHQATLNTPQILYFFLHVFGFSLPYMIVNLKFLYKWIQNHPLIVISTLLSFVVMVHFNTIVHPYLLSDNRHYIFYIWNKFYGRFTLFRYFVIPIYMLGAFLTYKFMQKRSLIFCLSYLVCSFAPIVLQKLLEPRYFIIPFILLRLQFVSNSWKVLISEFVFYLCINIVTVVIFISKTFMWHDLDEPQRIIW